MVPVNATMTEVEEEGGSRQVKPSTERVLTHNVSEKRRKKIEYVATYDYTI